MKKDEKTKKNKGGSVFVWVMLIIFLVAAALLYFGMNGFGLGGNGGGGDGAVPAMADTSAPETVSETDVTTEEIEYISITVDGNSYLYNNKKYDIDNADELIGDIKSLDEKLTVRIKDENASVKAYETLTKLLSDNDYSYIEVSGDE